MCLQGSGGVLEGTNTARALTIGKAVELEHKAKMYRRGDITIPTTTSRASELDYFTKPGYKDPYARQVAARRYRGDREE